MDDFYTDLLESIQNNSNRIGYWLSLLQIPESDGIVIPPIRKHDRKNTVEYANTVVDYIAQRNNNNLKIVFSLPDEGFITFYLRFIDIVARRLIVEHNFSRNNMFYLTGAANTEMNRQKYDKYCAEMQYFPIRVRYVNQFECNNAGIAKSREYYHSTEPKRDKKFICFNKQPRSHRIQIFSEIKKRNLRDKCHLSFYFPYESLRLTKLKRLYPNHDFSTDLEILRNSKSEFPIKLTMQENESNMHNLNQDDEFLFKSALFSLVTETLFNNSINYWDENNEDNIHCYPCNFHSEKIWNAVRAKHPFIVASTPYFLQSLREIGYKTFHPYIDESYDHAQDDQLRLSMIMDEVERLCNMSDSETREWLTDVHKITKFNYDLLLTRHANTIGIQD